MTDKCPKCGAEQSVVGGYFRCDSFRASEGEFHQSGPCLVTERNRLESAIATHHAQHADDLCWQDDAKLYEAAGLPPRQPTVGDPEAMLANCKRFIAQRCIAGGPWVSYAELERERDHWRNLATMTDEEVVRLRKQLASVREILETAVDTTEPDKGVVLLSYDGPCHEEEIDGHTMQVYDHLHFSPLGDALIAAWELTEGSVASP